MTDAKRSQAQRDRNDVDRVSTASYGDRRVAEEAQSTPISPFCVKKKVKTKIKRKKLIDLFSSGFKLFRSVYILDIQLLGLNRSV